MAWSSAANLTDDMDNRLADLEVRLYAVMLEQDDIGILLCNDVREMLECAGASGMSTENFS